MSLITHIDNVPLFTTIQEAETWGDLYNLTGYHEHTILGQTGYMGGATHQEIVTAMIGGTAQTTNTTTSTSGGGGGY